MIQGYSQAIATSAFFVPVLTEEYCDRNRSHIRNELRMALEKNARLREVHGLNFVFPYALCDGKELIELITELNGLFCASNVPDLVKAFAKFSPLALLENGTDPLGFLKDWPARFFTAKGEPDVLLVLGHSGKESAPRAEDIRNLGISTMEEDLATRYMV